jgi:hypothetical protein
MARENIHILLEKSDEREFLFGLQVCADMELLVQVTRVSQDFFVCDLLFLVMEADFFTEGG